MSITSSSSPGASTTFGLLYKQVQKFSSRSYHCHRHYFWCADLPWRTCENDWNTPSCRSPYEHKVMVILVKNNELILVPTGIITELNMWLWSLKLTIYGGHNVTYKEVSKHSNQIAYRCHKVSDVCHLTEEKYPCADLGEDYRDCVVRDITILLIIVIGCLSHNPQNFAWCQIPHDFFFISFKTMIN